jgi:hypothetical protein
MPAHEVRKRVRRSADEVFDFIGTHVYENHPRWEAEVVEIRPLDSGPVRLGSRAVMVRKEFGRQKETDYEVTEFVPGRTISFRHRDPSMAFDLTFQVDPAGPTASELTTRVRMQPYGTTRLMTPLLALMMPRRSERLTSRMVELVEAEPGRA